MLDDINNRDIRSLDRVVMLAEELNYQRASDRLGITQSALSRSIANLEGNLGVVLFDRDKTGVRLTRTGFDFVKSAKALIRQYNSFLREFNGYGSPGSRRISFGIVPALSQMNVVQKAMQILLSDKSGFNVDIDVKGGDHLLKSLLADEIEFFLCADRHVDKSVENISKYPLCQIELAIFARKGHPLVGKSVLEERDLRGYPICSTLLPVWARKNSDLLYGWREEHKFATAIYSDDTILKMKLAAETDCLIVLDKEMASTDFACGLVELPAESLISKWKNVNVVIVTLENRRMSPLAQYLIDTLIICGSEG